jgi:hypothetical protein
MALDGASGLNIWENLLSQSTHVHLRCVQDSESMWLDKSAACSEYSIVLARPEHRYLSLSCVFPICFHDS